MVLDFREISVPNSLNRFRVFRLNLDLDQAFLDQTGSGRI